MYRIIIVALLLVQSVTAQTGGESLFTFLNLPTSPKQIALGGITLTSDDDVSQLIWNPSIASSQLDRSIAVNYVKFIADINAGSVVFAKGLGENLDKGTAFFTAQFQNYGTLSRTAASGPEILGTFDAKDIVFGAGYAYTFNEITVGATLKYLSSNIDTFKSTALLYDLALTYKNPNVPFIMSLSTRNRGKQLSTFQNEEEKIKSVLTFAVSYELKHVPLKFYGALDEINNWDIAQSNPSRQKQEINDTVIEEEISDLDTFFRHLSIGAELWPKGKFNIRAGYNHRRAQEFQLEDAKTNAGLSFGFGFKINTFKFSYAFSKFQEGASYNAFGLTLNL